MKTDKTQRGFGIIQFDDLYGQHCSIQESSIATRSCIWFGVDNTGDQIEGATGEKNCEGARMHLTVEQVNAILPILQKFVKNGYLPMRHKKI
jgi:hypothetical protein